MDELALGLAIWAVLHTVLNLPHYSCYLVFLRVFET